MGRFEFAALFLVLLAILGAVLGGLWGAVIAVAIPFLPILPFAVVGIPIGLWKGLTAKPDEPRR